MPAQTIPVLSLFSGAGGMDLGFSKAGMEAVMAFDIDEPSVRSYNHNAKHPVANQVDLATLKDETLLNWLNEKCKHNKPRGIIGGPPCQGFSAGNVHANPKDPRNLLPYRYAKILETVSAWNKIDFFVFENVPGLKSKRHLPRFQRIMKRLANIGFNIHEKEIDASKFSLPQKRRRLFLVGISDRLSCSDRFEFPSETKKRKTVRDAIGDLPEPVFFKPGLTQNDIPHHPNHWTMFPRSKRFTEKSFNQGRSFRKLDWDQPSWTVAYGNREIHVHPEGHRRLSIYEALLLQGFPKRFVLSGNFSQQADQVSNAVPPPIAYQVAKSIRSLLY